MGSGRFHLGEDVLKPSGTPVYACADGIVKLANNKHAGDGNYGGLIIVEHTFPAGETVCSLYGHLDHNKTLVGETEIVKKGETIGVIGREDPNINGNSTPHLHFGIRYGAFSGEYASDPNTTSGWYWAGYGKVDPNIKTNWWLKPSKLIKDQTNFSSTPTPIITPPPEPINGNAQSEIAWYDQEGMQIAKSQNKPAMIFFYSDRCPASAKLAEVFVDTRVINMSKNFVPIVGSRGLDRQYGIRYVPTIVFTNSQGMEIHRIVGYRDSDTLVNEMQYALMLSTTLDVPFFSQRDPAWRDKKLDHSPYSIGEYGCALTSAAMVAKYFGYDTDPDKLNTHLTAVGGLDTSGIIYWKKVEEVSDGKVAWIESVGASWSRIDQELSSEYPVICSVNCPLGTHFTFSLVRAEMNITS